MCWILEVEEGARQTKSVLLQAPTLVHAHLLAQSGHEVLGYITYYIHLHFILVQIV